PDRGQPGLGAVRLGRAGVGRVRVRSRRPADPRRSRPPREARRRAVPRHVRVVRGATMTSTIDRSARVGLVTDQTGALSFMGIANVNVTKMVIDDINAHGG